MNRLVRNVSMSFAFILGVIIGLEYQNSYAILDTKYRVKVTFDNITVHSNRETVGDGEFDLSAYVQDKRVYLTDASEIWDAGEGETYSFNPGTEVTMEIPKTVPLSIFTAGVEVDDDGPIDWAAKDDSLEIARLIAELHDPEVENKLPGLTLLRDKLELHIGCYIACNHNDRLGHVENWYDAPNYGAGPHEVKSHRGDFTLRYTISVSKTLERVPTIFPEPLQRVCNSNLPITSVTASGNDGNVPQNVLDNNLNTRWSSDGVGQFITADLGSTKNICSVDIAWFRGNERMYGFQISASTDGSSFKKLETTSSSGTTVKSEKYIIPPTDARYVRVTVTGNTVNNFASITELDIFG